MLRKCDMNPIIKKEHLKHYFMNKQILDKDYTVVVNSNEEFLFVLDYLRSRYSDLLGDMHDLGYNKYCTNNSYFIGRYKEIDGEVCSYYDSRGSFGDVLSFVEFKMLVTM